MVITDRQELMHEALKSIAEESLTFRPRQKSVSLLSGKAGLALFYAYLYRQLGNQEHFDQFSTLLDECFGEMGDATLGATFVGGITGVGWLIRHLVAIELLEESSLGSLEVIEEYIVQSLALDERNKKYEIFTGAAGKGLYFLEGPMTATAQAALERILEILKAGAIHEDGGITWLTKSWTGTEIYYDLGLPHGVPGIILFLCRVYKANISRDLTLELIQGAVSWVLEKEQHTGAGYFPHIVGRPFAGRLAWCYGDMGVAAALLEASEVLSIPALRDKALWVLDKEAPRDLSSARVFKHPRYDMHDRGLCHGTAGIALFFNSFYKKTGIEKLQVARDYWTDITLSIKKTGKDKGIGGYIFPTANSKDVWRKNPYVLEGSVGVGLAFLSLLQEKQLPWERSFLLC